MVTPRVLKVSFIKKLSSDGRVLLFRLPQDAVDSLNLEPGDYCQISIQVVKRRLDELLAEGASREDAERFLEQARPGKKAAPLQSS